MAKRSKSMEAGKIAERAMKGWRVKSARKLATDAPRNQDTAPADAVMPDLSELRKKYLGDGSETPEKDAISSTGAEPTQIVELEKGGLSKVVGVSAGKVKWQQG